MPQPHLRTRSKKRLKMILPGGKNRINYKKKMMPIPSCFLCGQPLAGISHLTRAKIGKLNRSKRRIWRPYGGEICHNCLKNSLKQAARTL